MPPAWDAPRHRGPPGKLLLVFQGPEQAFLEHLHLFWGMHCFFLSVPWPSHHIIRRYVSHPVEGLVAFQSASCSRARDGTVLNIPSLTPLFARHVLGPLRGQCLCWAPGLESKTQGRMLPAKSSPAHRDNARTCGTAGDTDGLRERHEPLDRGGGGIREAAWRTWHWCKVLKNK